MENDFLEKISEMINHAIIAYEELLELYIEKKEAILKPDKDMLASVDEKIISHVQTIKGLNEKREEYCKLNGIETVKITELIELAKREKPGFEDELEKQKVKICEVADKIALIDRTNVELIRHNLTMSDKLLDIIISAAMPQKDNYDMHGKNVDKSELSISSIVEDA